MSTSSSKPPAQSFEFTKRKRWSETLFSELSETLVFVLSPTCKVLYCGSAIVELLGWKEDQLVDADLAAFIDDEDQENFRWSLTESLRSGQDLYTYARFKYEQPPPTDANIKPGQLFEIKGHPNYLQDNQEPHCFFLTAMPYPSRNISMLNTFLDLKIENQKLSQRVNELKNSIDASQALENNSPVSSPFAMSHFPPRFNQYTGPLIPNHSSLYSRGPPFFGGFDLSSGSVHGARKSSLSRVDDTMVSPVNGRGGLGLTGDEEGDEGGQKKKKVHIVEGDLSGKLTLFKQPKKTLLGDEQRVCVTCGRTDSPEWRKGPLGPKTLCNACGLRWAKRIRKVEPDTVTTGNLKDPNDGDPSSQQSSLDLPCGQQSF